MRQQRSIWEVAQSNFELECQVVERSQDAAVRRLSCSPILHCTALSNRIIRQYTDGGEHRFHGFAEPLDEGTSIPCRHHYGQQASLAYGQHDLDSSDANQVGVPVAEDGVRWCWRRIRRAVEPVEQFLGTAKYKHSGEVRGRRRPSIKADQRSAVADEESTVQLLVRHATLLRRVITSGGSCVMSDAGPPTGRYEQVLMLRTKSLLDGIRVVPTTPPTPRLLGAWARHLILAALFVHAGAQASDCPTTKAERFDEFFKWFSSESLFAFSRKDLPLLTERWSGEDSFGEPVEPDDVWVSREAYARRPSLQVLSTSQHMVLQTVHLAPTAATIELLDRDHLPTQALHFKLDAGCWRLMWVEEFERW